MKPELWKLRAENDPTTLSELPMATKEGSLPVLDDWPIRPTLEIEEKLKEKEEPNDLAEERSSPALVLLNSGAADLREEEVGGKLNENWEESTPNELPRPEEISLDPALENIGMEKENEKEEKDAEVLLEEGKLNENGKEDEKEELWEDTREDSERSDEPKLKEKEKSDLWLLNSESTKEEDATGAEEVENGKLKENPELWEEGLLKATLEMEGNEKLWKESGEELEKMNELEDSKDGKLKDKLEL